MVSINRGPRSGAKTSEQQRKSTMRNRQSCSMRYRKDVEVSLGPEPNWDEEEKNDETKND